ncbi:hypothetical protein ABTD78_23265, partial [Acinetobacter baumannii]
SKLIKGTQAIGLASPFRIHPTRRQIGANVTVRPAATIVSVSFMPQLRIKRHDGANGNMPPRR